MHYYFTQNGDDSFVTVLLKLFEVHDHDLYSNWFCIFLMQMYLHHDV